MNNVFVNAEPILQTLHYHGYKAFFVGGAVRDFLIGRPIGDIDIATSATPEQVQGIFEKVIPVGIEHGTVMVRYGEESFEVTTFRTEGDYHDYRHPDQVYFVEDIQDDLARRDFTMNAIAMDIDGELIDPYNGAKAIKRNQIETVGKAEDRFEEDPLRMMRALRFVSQLGFTLSPTTYHAIQQHASLLENIAIERLSIEFEKLIQGDGAKHAWALFTQSNMEKYLPVLKEEPSLMKRCSNKNWLALGDFSEAICMFHILEPTFSIEYWVKEWKLSNKVKRKATRLLNAYTEWMQGNTIWAIYKLGFDQLPPFTRVINLLSSEEKLEVASLEKMYHHLPIYNREELAVNGKDIRSWFPNRTPGPWIESMLVTIERVVIEGELTNEKGILKERVLQWNPQEEN
ncbi:CCA tRNA nucleotidyltransferase [Pontibacillus yanchengensis]|uniref:CCA-adding enzyme n=1 Tax=Pontibacillus yanchengensis Y32 TaxID=1385514 RepID=A0A0A2TFZ6_9BACI|nr:CCA tRNA nucleotidyltransferase [Pontibacillus yanchengensis]KGP73031.1 tRNA CCA-pyrophosphorylase [Pontibacillus yanchengensis Y32]